MARRTRAQPGLHAGRAGSCPTSEAAIDGWVAHRRRGPVLLVRRRRRHRRPPPRRAGRVPDEHGRHRLRRRPADRAGLPGERRAGHLPRPVPPGPVRPAPLAVVCDDYEADRDAYLAAGAELAYEAPHRWPHPHVLGRHVAHPRVHGRAARAEPGPGHGLRHHARRRRVVGRHEPDHPLLTWASTDRPSRSCSPQIVARASRPPGADRRRRDPHLRRARPPLGPHGPGAARRAAPAREPASGVLAPDGALLLTTFYAALRIGALVTPISTLTTPPELAHIIRTSDAQLLVGARRFLRNDFAANLEAALPGLADADRGTLLAHRRAAPPVDLARRRRRTTRGPARSTSCSAERRRRRRRAPRGRRGRGVPGRRCVRRLHLRQHGDAEGGRAQPALGRDQATSAGAHLPHGRRRPHAVAAARLLAGRHRRRAAGAVHGSTLVYPPTPHIDDVLDMIERHDVTYVVVWHTLAKLRAAAKARGIDVDRIRGMGVTAARRARRADPARRSGPTSSGCRRASRPTAASRSTGVCPAGKEGSSGRAINGIERRVVDPETGEEVAPGEVGELQLRGGGLMTGFYKVDRDDGVHRRRLLPDQGPRPHRRRRLPVVRRPHRRHDQDELRQRLAPRGRGGVARAPRGGDRRSSPGCRDPDLGELVVAAVIPAPGAEPTEEGSAGGAARAAVRASRSRAASCSSPHDDVPQTPTGKVRLFDLATMIESRLAAAPAEEEPMITLTNARVFDGRAMLPGRHDVTLDGKRIASISEHTGTPSSRRGGRCRRHDRAPRASSPATCTPTSTSSRSAPATSPARSSRRA